MTQFKITTNDNPFDPFEEWDDWFFFDVEHGYYSCSRLDRIVNIGDDFTERETNAELERAIDQIIKHDFTDTYKKVSKDYPDLDDSSEDLLP